MGRTCALISIIENKYDIEIIFGVIKAVKVEQHYTANQQE